MSITRKDRVVWAEIPVSDMARAKGFYAGLLGAPLVDETGGPNPLAMLPRDGDDVVGGHLYPGTPAAKGSGPTIHLAVSCDLEAAMERVRTGGGEVVSPVVTIPAGSFFYALDTEGNSVGVFKV